MSGIVKPLLYDVFSGAGGAAKGYMDAGFRVIGVDNKPQPRYCGDGFMQMDAFDFFADYLDGKFEEAAAFHCSPPCQGYSIMRNLPWLSGKEYPLLILPTREMLIGLGKPWVIENVYGAHYGSKGLKKLGIEAHGMQAGWLCGGMFGLPLYRHRLFETPFLWMQPAHPKHRSRYPPGITSNHRGRGVTENLLNNHARPDFSGTSDAARLALAGVGVDERGLQSWPGRRDKPAGLETGSLARWQGNGAQSEGVGVGHAAGWRLAAAAMGIDWGVKRDELTQMVPPAFTKYVGRYLLAACEVLP